jgi:Restriction Enzyme Adenine Methylase Associated/Type I restriction enzyme R protein N terminus (HSDR_N)
VYRGGSLSANEAGSSFALERLRSLVRRRAAQRRRLSLVADLHSTLADVRDRIDQHQGKGIGEQNTKAVLINPVLRALGWDLEDLDEVELEFKRKAMDNPVDYALMIQRTPRLFIEAKSLDGNLSDPKWAGQIMAYATVAGVQWVALTDGNEYRIYNSHAPVPVDQKLFRRARISDDTDVADTLQLLSKDRMQQDLIGAMWKAHFVDQQVRSAFETLVQPDPSAGLIRLLRRQVPSLAPSEIRDGLRRMELRFDFPSPPAGPAKPDSPVSAPANARRAVAPAGTPWRTVTMTDLFAAGTLKPPVELQKTYKGRLLSGRIESDGQVSFAGKRYDSLSTAAGQARKSVIGTSDGRPYPQTNGWTFWHFEDADGSWQEVDVLRKRHWAKQQG